MKLNYPLLLRSKLAEIVDSHQYTIGFSNEIKNKVINKCIDLWLYIMNSQLRQYNNNADLKTKLDRMKLYAFDEPVSIHKETLSRRFRIHRHLYYNHFLTLLKDIDVIKIDEWYKVGSQSKGYKINKKVLKSVYGEIVWIEPTDPTDRYKYKNKEEWIKLFPENKNLIENHYKCLINIEELERELKTQVVLGEIGIDKYFSFLNQSLIFNQKYFWFARKDGRGRFYSSFTSLPKVIRKHITLDGSFVCEIDLKNAMPLFVSYVVDNKDYRDDCLKGVFWEKIANHLQIEKAEVKVLFFTDIMYNNTLRKTKMYRAVEELYPGLYDMIDEVKQRGDIYEKYTDLESKIFIDGMKIFEFPYLSIHDCLVVRNIDIDKKRAEAALKYVFASKNLEIPTFSVKCV
jgi:hypothetical protein